MLLRINKTNSRFKRAFTLVELIVVLVILAVISAILVPALTGYIRKARKANYIQVADEARVAAQAVMSEFYVADIDLSLDKYLVSTGSAANVNWYSGDLQCYGDKVLELMGLGRGEENGEPYILVVGVGHDLDPNLSEAQQTTVYYVGYVADLGSPSVFYVNGEWTYMWPRDDGALQYNRLPKSNATNYTRNTLVTPNGNICIRYYVICDRAGDDNIWLDKHWKVNHSTLEGNSEGHRLS